MGAGRAALVGPGGENQGAGSKVRTERENLLGESEQGPEGWPSGSNLTHMSLSCRVSHGIAGTLLGEMALCAKKRPPGKTGGGCPWAYQEWA